MKTNIVLSRLALASAALVFASSSYGAITLTKSSNATASNKDVGEPTTADAGKTFSATSWASQASSTDLINSGRATLGAVTSSGIGTNTLSLGVDKINNANGTVGTVDGSSGFYISSSDFNLNTHGFTDAGNTATVTFTLNTGTNTFGYTLTSIKSFMGLTTAAVSDAQANQTYSVFVHHLGDAEGVYTLLTTVDYHPFSTTTSSGSPYHLSYVNIDEDNGAGILASGVDAIQFSFAKTAVSALGNNKYDGTVINELDVIGYATAVPEPSTYGLIGAGALAGVAFVRRRRRA